MNETKIRYHQKLPDKDLSDLVERFWMIENLSDSDWDIVVLPDGRVDIFLTASPTEPFHIRLMGLEAEPSITTFPAKRKIFAISLRPLSVECLLHNSISKIINSAKALPKNFWGFSGNDLLDFDSFCAKATIQIKKRGNADVDPRKRSLFACIYQSKGQLSVHDLAEKVSWSSRQINRYFNQTFGLSLKAYCNILRFRASFEHLQKGELFPESNFVDQAHFIKEVKKFSGVTPKVLSKNENDRFIQFSTLKTK